MTASLLLDPLTFACYEDLVLALFIFFAWKRCVTRSRVWMSARLLFTTLLLAMPMSIFAIARSMTGLSTRVSITALQLGSTNFTAPYFGQPARLVLHLVLPTHAEFGGKERTLWASFVVQMAIVRHLRVSTSFWSFAFIAAWWWLRSTGQR